MSLKRERDDDDDDDDDDDKEEEDTADNGKKIDEIDYATVFSATRVKAQIVKNKGVGRISKRAAEYMTECSAMFFHSLIKDAFSDNDDDGTTTTTTKKKDGNNVVDLQKIKEAATKHTFLRNALDQITEESAPKKKPRRKHNNNNSTAKKKKAKSALSGIVQEDSTVQQQVEKEAAAASAPVIVVKPQPEITLDEDDYD